MILRVSNDAKYLAKYPTYKNCTVCDDWLLFTNFKTYFDSNHKTDVDGKSFTLDKDILFVGNKHYSPETCVFVPNVINQIYKHHNNASPTVPLHKGKYRVRVHEWGKPRYIGIFTDETEANIVRETAKRNYHKSVAEHYLNLGLLDDRVYTLMTN